MTLSAIKVRYSSAAVIPSGNPVRIKDCLERLARQTVPFDRIIVAVWGQNPEQEQQVISLATSTLQNVEIVESEEDTRPESNLNNAIRHLSRNPTNRVAFLNDDTFLDERWHESMQYAAQRDGEKVSHASLVIFKSFPNLVQGAGHILIKAKPRDHEYKKTISGPLDSQPLCPCGNSAFVPWGALEEILNRDSRVWEPDFIRWQSCFDFGLKLRLSGCGCRLVSSARAIHEGYLDKSLRGEKLKAEEVKMQLRSRRLLYGKFFPEEERKEAVDILERSLERWAQSGYPHAEDVSGDLVRSIYTMAKMEAKGLLEKVSLEWLELVGRIDPRLRRRWLFGER
jgi:GT2 family glycosyltransferase